MKIIKLLSISTRVAKVMPPTRRTDISRGVTVGIISVQKKEANKLIDLLAMSGTNSDHTR